MLGKGHGHVPCASPGWGRKLRPQPVDIPIPAYSLESVHHNRQDLHV
jgi:hypothetical protein